MSTKWTYNDQEICEENVPPDAVGFIYRIRNRVTNRLYIGKKTLYFVRTRRAKKSRKRLKTVNKSDWETYWGSNKELVGDVAKLGEENFTREIIRFCYSKGEANYYEAKYILESDAIIRDDYYNSWISVKVSTNHVRKTKDTNTK